MTSPRGGGSSYGLNAKIADEIQTLIRRNAKLARLGAKIGTHADSQEFRDQLQLLEGETRESCRWIMNALRQSKREGGDSRLLRKLAYQFEDEFEKYKKAAESIEAKQRAVIVAMSRSQKKQGHGQYLTPEESTLSEEQSQQQMIDQIDSQFQVFDLEEIKKRREGVKMIERDVTELSEMFKDLRTLVDVQQEDIDSIETNVQQTKVRTEEGLSELQKAEHYQRKARKKTCVLLMIVVGVLLAIVLGGLAIGKVF